MTASLLPQPRRLSALGATVEIPKALSFRISAKEPESSWLEARLVEALSNVGIVATPTDGSDRFDLSLEVIGNRASESYRLQVAPTGSRIQASDEAGLFYGMCTLVQWLDIRGRRTEQVLSCPAVEIHDGPSFATRGVMLDISRNKVPTMKTLYRLVDRLAGWKINHLELYLEHTFAYRGHQPVWEGWSPITAEEVRALDDYCRQRFIELAPNQNSFGHFHRWLVVDSYRHLAECPEGIEHPFSQEVEPFSLCPTDPGTFELLADLYTQLLPNFRSRLFNVGLDETFDLGKGRSAQICAALGTGRVYVEFLQKIHRMVRERDHRMLFWGDIILEHPELVPELPGDAIALEWGYEADHPFAEHGRRFSDSGIEFWVCPGTSSWLSFAGRSDNALLNVRNAAKHGLENGATGLLITDWGDHGHLQPLPVSDLGFAAGAAYAWNASSTEQQIDWPSQLDTHAFRDRARVLGRSLFDLGNVYQAAGAITNSSVLFRLLLAPEENLLHRRFDGLTIEGLRDALEEVVSASQSLDRAQSERDDADVLVKEAKWISEVLAFSARLGLVRLGEGRERRLCHLPSRQRERLRTEVQLLREGAREIWLERNRPGGLERSLQLFDRLKSALSV